MKKAARETYRVLVADDSETDRHLLKLAMRRASRLQLIAEVAHGAELIAYLQGEARFADREKHPLPDLLLLDLHMPHKDGFEVLKWMQTQPFEDVVVVVLTDSMQAAHIKRALDLGADLFQVKPLAAIEREAMILALEEYLLNPGQFSPRHPHLHAPVRPA